MALRQLIQGLHLDQIAASLSLLAMTTPKSSNEPPQRGRQAPRCAALDSQYLVTGGRQ